MTRHGTVFVVPELPEMEIVARRLDAALPGELIESALTPGINALKTFDPPLHALDGREIEGVRRIGKHLVVDVADLAVHPHPHEAGLPHVVEDLVILALAAAH